MALLAIVGFYQHFLSSVYYPLSSVVDNRHCTTTRAI